jgi:hypothetical protein
MKKLLVALAASLFIGVGLALALDDGSTLVSSGQFNDQQAKVLISLFTQLQQPVVPAANEEAVAAAGSAQGSAAALSATKFLHQVTGADGTKGVILPATVAADAGKVHLILGTTAGVLKIYPATGGTINGGSANAALSFTTGVLMHMCWPSATADTWICA